MMRPSERALNLADEILDHVRWGLTRADALHELAEMIDENNADLVQAVHSVLRAADRQTGRPGDDVLTQLRDTVRDYQPLRFEADAHPELFVRERATLF